MIIGQAIRYYMDRADLSAVASGNLYSRKSDVIAALHSDSGDDWDTASKRLQQYLRKRRFTTVLAGNEIHAISSPFTLHLERPLMVSVVSSDGIEITVRDRFLRPWMVTSVTTDFMCKAQRLAEEVKMVVEPETGDYSPKR